MADQVTAARHATWRRETWFSSAVMVRNAGITANGSTRNKIEVKAINENLTTTPKVALINHLNRYDIIAERRFHNATWEPRSIEYGPMKATPCRPPAPPCAAPPWRTSHPEVRRSSSRRSVRRTAVVSSGTRPLVGHASIVSHASRRDL